MSTAGEASDPTNEEERTSMLIRQYSALIDAVRQSDLLTIEEAPDEVVRMVEKDGFTLLHLAALYGKHRIVRHLLERGLDPHKEAPFHGMPYEGKLAKPIDLAETFKRDKVVPLLRAAMEGKAVPDWDRYSTVSYVCSNEQVADVRDVLRGPGDPVLAQVEDNGSTLLHVAVLRGDPDILSLLISYGVDLQARMIQRFNHVPFDDRMTPLDLARIMDIPKAVAVLEEACNEANDGKGIDGETANVTTIPNPDGGLLVKVLNKFTGEPVHRTMAERLTQQALAAYGGENAL